tara:strand:+ start:769 stop:2478 length:1710 start_codon:yes stop_codon:yes gene_type:complete
MSYRNPSQYVDTTSVQHIQKLQESLSSTASKISQEYILKQKEIKAENLKQEEKNEKSLAVVNADIATMRVNMGKTAIENPDVNFGPAYEVFIKEFEELGSAVAYGTSENPSKDRKRMAEIQATVGGVKQSIVNLVSYGDGHAEKLELLGKPGGYYKANDNGNMRGMNILTGLEPGIREPRFVDGDTKKQVWDIKDQEGNLVATFSRQQLENLQQKNSELLVTIPDQTQNNTDVKLANDNIFEYAEENGKKSPTDVINKKFLVGSVPGDKDANGEIIYNVNPDNLERVNIKKGDVNRNYFQNYAQVDKYGENGIYNNSNFSTTVLAESNSLLEVNGGDQAKALHNTSFSKIKYRTEDFLNNPNVVDGQGNQYTEKASLPDKIKEAIDDKVDPGYEFNMDVPMDKTDQAIFNVAYKRNFVDEKIPNTMPVGEEQYENVVPIETLGINEIKALDKKEQVDYLINKIKDLDIPRNLENGNIAISKPEFNSYLSSLGLTSTGDYTKNGVKYVKISSLTNKNTPIEVPATMPYLEFKKSVGVLSGIPLKQMDTEIPNPMLPQNENVDEDGLDFTI